MRVPSDFVLVLRPAPGASATYLAVEVEGELTRRGLRVARLAGPAPPGEARLAVRPAAAPGPASAPAESEPPEPAGAAGPGVASVEAAPGQDARAIVADLEERGLVRPAAAYDQAEEEQVAARLASLGYLD